MAATQMGWAFQFAPTGAFTLEANVIFETYALALAFAKTDPTAVVGKVISVSTGDEKGVYMIEAIGTNGSLKKVGSDVDLSNYVTKDQITSMYTYKGTKATYDELVAIENPKVGDAYNVEGEVEIISESPLGDTITKKYPAGTNWVWNGSEWDAQGGSIDLSVYATKEEVGNVNEALTGSIGSLTGEVNQIKTNLDKKVDSVEGSSLITSEKLALIDTNADAIAQLQQTDTSLDTRLKVVESAFTGDGGTIDLGDLTAQLTDHGSRITVLEGDNTTNKTNIGNLQTEVSGHASRLTAIENLNTEQGTQLSGLTTRVSNVEKYGESITNLTTTVNGHTDSISELRTDLTNEITNRGTAVNEAKTHAETKATEALNAAKEYADGLAGNYDEAGAAAAVDAKLTAEISRAEASEKANADAIAAEKARLDLFLADADTTEKAVDTLKEIQAYITSDGAAAEQMLTAINEAKTAATTAQNEVDALELVVTAMDEAYKAADTTTLTAAKEYVDGKIELLGTAAYKDVEFFATAAQGLLAEAAAPQATTYTKTEVDNQIANAFEWVNVQ